IAPEALPRQAGRLGVGDPFLHEGRPAVLPSFFVLLFEAIDEINRPPALSQDTPHVQEAQWGRPESVRRNIVDVWIDKENLQRPFHVLPYGIDAVFMARSPEMFHVK